MNKFVYEYPKTVELKNGTKVDFDLNDMKNERMLAIVIASEMVDSFSNYLFSQGFQQAVPAWKQGETIGVSKVVTDPWEMHIRIFSNGYIYSHIEVRRDYFEHLDERYIWPLYDEPLALVSKVTGAFGIMHLKSKQWVGRVITKTRMSISPPSSLTEWKPIATAVGVIVAGAALGYALAKLLDYLSEDSD